MENNRQNWSTSGSSQGPFCIWQGLDFPMFVRFLSRRPPLSWRYGGRLLSTALLSLNNSFLGAMEAAIYRRRIAEHKIEQPPVFIVGHWRSGTTLLHQLMSLDNDFVCPNLYQVLNPQHFLLSERVIAPLTGWLLPRTRPMDNIPVSWDMPQEDEVALANLTLASPYLQTAFHARPEEYNPYLTMDEVPEDVVQFWAEKFVWFVKRVTMTRPGVLLLKSPSHTFRIRRLMSLFPGARFVHIVRNPYAVYLSGMHLRERLYVENGFAPPDLSYNAIDVLNTYDKCMEVALREGSEVPAGRWHELRFEDLERDPAGELESIYKTLDLPNFGGLKTALEPQLDSVRKFRKNQYPPIDDATKRRIYSRVSHVFDRYGYSSDLPVSATSRAASLTPSTDEPALVA